MRSSGRRTSASKSPKSSQSPGRTGSPGPASRSARRVEVLEPVRSGRDASIGPLATARPPADRESSGRTTARARTVRSSRSPTRPGTSITISPSCKCSTARARIRSRRRSTRHILPHSGSSPATRSRSRCGLSGRPTATRSWDFGDGTPAVDVHSDRQCRRACAKTVTRSRPTGSRSRATTSSVSNEPTATEPRRPRGCMWSSRASAESSSLAITEE